MMKELNIPSTATAVAAHYEGLIDGFVLDAQDRAQQDTIGVPCVVTQSVMLTLDDRIALARTTLDFLRSLG